MTWNLVQIGYGMVYWQMVVVVGERVNARYNSMSIWISWIFPVLMILTQWIGDGRIEFKIVSSSTNYCVCALSMHVFHHAFRLDSQSQLDFRSLFRLLRLTIRNFVYEMMWCLWTKINWYFFNTVQGWEWDLKEEGHDSGSIRQLVTRRIGHWLLNLCRISSISSFNCSTLTPHKVTSMWYYVVLHCCCFLTNFPIL